MFYRFDCGTFIEAVTFEEAQTKFVERIKAETEEPKRWCKCTCLGLGHRFECPEAPHNNGIIAF
jgi:hypothetical protein